MNPEDLKPNVNARGPMFRERVQVTLISPTENET
jgi:hypothetical protein